MFMMCLNETIDQLAIVCWYGHVLRIEDGHVLTRALKFEFEGHKKKEG